MDKLISVTVYGTEQKADERDTDAQMGIGHARHGQPVAVTICRGNNSHTLHLSFAEATQLAAELERVRAGK